jgi:hypothetical protein
MWMLFLDILGSESIGTISINVENKFMKLWYIKKKKITLQDMSLGKQEGPTQSPK